MSVYINRNIIKGWCILPRRLTFQSIVGPKALRQRLKRCSPRFSLTPWRRARRAFARNVRPRIPRVGSTHRPFSICIFVFQHCMPMQNMHVSRKTTTCIYMYILYKGMRSYVKTYPKQQIHGPLCQRWAFAKHGHFRSSLYLLSCGKSSNKLYLKFANFKLKICVWTVSINLPCP